MNSFTKRVLRILMDKSFNIAYFTHRLWMSFRETKETEKDTERMFHQVREKMKQRVTLKKKESDSGKFVVSYLIGGIDYPCALWDTCSSLSNMPRVVADHLSLHIEPSEESFTFMDCSKRNSGGIVKNFEVRRNRQKP